MTAMLSTPRLELIDRLIAADSEVVRLLAHLRDLDRRLAAARYYRDRSAVHTPLGHAYLGRLEGEYEAALVELRAARREAQALVRVN